jgi:hypothetical protein
LCFSDTQEYNSCAIALPTDGLPLSSQAQQALVGFSQKCVTPSLPKQGFYILHEIELALLEVLIS